MTTDDESDLETLYTAFVLSMVMASVLATPAILAMGYATAWRRILKEI